VGQSARKHKTFDIALHEGLDIYFVDGLGREDKNPLPLIQRDVAWGLSTTNPKTLVCLKKLSIYTAIPKTRAIWA